jgi:non-ribosomal peptide synthase protein (TIGR01720 family)
MAALLEVEERLVPALMEMAVERLLHHHDALRLRFTRDGADWRATVAGLDGVIPYSHVDLSSHADAEVECALEASADRLQASLDLAAGPIVRVATFDLGPDRSGRLLIVVHHLACDVVSWPILLEDLASLYDQLGRGDAIALPAKTMSVQRWAQRLFEYGRQPERANDLGFWQRECGGPCVRLPRDLAGSGAAIADVDVVRSVLGGAETEMIRAFAAASHVSIEVVLLTGLATTLAEHAGSEAVMVYLERHGREAVFPDVDVSRTVGWFTAVFPVRVPVGARHRPGEALALVDRHLREIPVGGIGYGVLQYGPGPADVSLRGLPRPEVSFNYLGGIDPPRQARWRRASESAGREVGLRGVRPTILDVTAHIADATLRVAWTYSPTLHRRATIERLAGRLCDVVRELVTGEACRQPDVAGLRTRGGAS